MTALDDRIVESVENFKGIRRVLNERLIIGGKNLQHWKAKFFDFDIPEDADPIVCRHLSVKIMQLNQSASVFLTNANARYNAIKDSADWLYKEKYQELVAQYRQGERMPAAAFIETMAKASINEALNMAMVAEVEKNFWRDVINYLTRCRKQLENITMNNALIQRIEGQAGGASGYAEAPDVTAEEDGDFFDSDDEDEEE
jgi:hypothetical protein